jgi:predicted lipoprotein with Yx(FWY)xxD motif
MTTSRPSPSHSWRRSAAVCTLLAITAVLAAACGGSSKPASAKQNNVAIATAESDVGSILVDRDGNTLYLFAKDSRGASSCTGDCAKAWPPYAAKGTALHAGDGLKGSLLKRMTRADGAKQLTYNGHPLYTFSGDSKPGDITGQGSNAFGAHWYAVSPQGTAATKTVSAPKMGY